MTATKKIFLFCGSGGVGKTTCSAAFALKQAGLGFKTIVLTIDPAKRLATSLGLDSLNDEPRRIRVKNGNGGELWAMMLDTKRTFDRIVEKYAPSPEAKNRILKNKLYQHMSQMLAGTQEYMAMERLYEIHAQGLYDVIVIDTPPVQNAADFLNAPQKMMDMINNSMLHLLLKPTLALGKSGLKFFEKGSAQILKIFDRITGFAFLQDVSEMLIAFKELLGGFQSRSDEVRRLLSSECTQFVLVVTTAENSIDEAISFAARLDENSYKLGGVIVNRVYLGPVLADDKLTAMQKRLAKNSDADNAGYLFENYTNYIPLIKRDAASIKKLKTNLDHIQLVTIPLFLSDVHDMDDLLKIADIITL